MQKGCAMSRSAMHDSVWWWAVCCTCKRFAGRHMSCKGSLHAVGGMLDISRAMAFAPQRPQAAGAASPAEVIPSPVLLGVLS